MSKTEIIAELRRSAVDDFDPLLDVDFNAFYVVNQWRMSGGVGYTYDDDTERMFYLFVANALESE